MELTGLEFENYKAFQARTSIEVRTLTILIGRNSSGKSAIARLPLLLASGLSDNAQGPVALSTYGVDFGASFLDLIHRRYPHGKIGLGARFSDGGGTSTLWAEIQNLDEYKSQYVARLDIAGQNVSPIHLVANTRAPDARTYELEGLPSDLGVDFVGLRPQSYTTDDTPAGRAVNQRMHDAMLLLFGQSFALSNVTHLGPFRTQPQRTYRYPGSLPTSVGIGGELAPAILAAGALRKQSILDEVATWYANHLGGWRLSIVPVGETFAVTLRHPTDSSLEINLADVGVGMSQVLPIVVDRFIRGTRDNAIHIVEQPELHLHPGAHGSVADLYVDAARLTRSRFIIETHSENFVLRLRRRIAEGTVDPDDVVIYWVDYDGAEAHVERIDISNDGSLSSWPHGVFSEDLQEVAAIRAAVTAKS